MSLSGRRATTLFLLLVLAVLALNVLGTYQALTRPFPGHNDFMSRWEGVRSFVHDGLNPYGPEASLNIQRQIFGRAALPEEDPGYFAYPFYTVLLLWPLVLVDYALASALWMVLLEACLVGALLLLVQVFRWRPAPLLTAGLLVWTLIAYYPARGLLLGQPGLLVYALEVLALWALLRRRDGLAGAALALSTLKPQMGYLIVPFLLLWALREQRYRFAGSFALSFGGLLALSFLLLPSWFSDWLAQLALYPSYTAFGSPVWILSHWLTPGIDPATGALMGDARAGQALDLVLTGLLYALLLWVWSGVLVQRRAERWLWAVVMTLVLTHLVAPRTATPHYVIFIIPLIFYLRQMSRGRAALLLLALLVLPWLHFLVTVTGKFEHPTVYLPVPFLTLALLWWTRRRWWQTTF